MVCRASAENSSDIANLTGAKNTFSAPALSREAAAFCATREARMAEGSPQLSAMERLALAVGRLANESDRAKRAQWGYLKVLTDAVVGVAISRRLYVDGIDWLLDFQPDRGVVQA